MPHRVNSSASRLGLCGTLQLTELDHGQILVQAVVPVLHGYSAETLAAQTISF